MSVPRSLEDIAQALATEIGAWLENPDPEPADSMAEICLRSLQSAVDAERERVEAILADHKRDRDKAIAERDSWKAEAKKWEHLHEELAEPLLFEQRRDSFGPTEEMPETVKRIIAERDIYKAAFDTAHNALMAASMQIEARKLIPEGK